jgi:hypothetical protein
VAHYSASSVVFCPRIRGPPSLTLQRAERGRRLTDRVVFKVSPLCILCCSNLIVQVPIHRKSLSRVRPAPRLLLKTLDRKMDQKKETPQMRMSKPLGKGSSTSLSANNLQCVSKGLWQLVQSIPRLPLRNWVRLRKAPPTKAFLPLYRSIRLRPPWLRGV